MIDTPPPKELLFSGGAGALNYEMGFSQSLLEIIGRPKLSTYNLGGVSAGAACAAYMHCALNENDYDFKYWYQNSSRKFYEPANKKYFGFFTNSDLIYRLSKEFYIFCSDKGVPDFNSKYHCAMTILENFGVEKFIVDYFTSPDDFALAVKASCFIPGITSFGLYCTYRGKKALDGGIATPIPFKNENSEKVFINVLPDRWPFVRDRAENMKVLNIYESADLHFPMDYWLWKETWADEMFLKGYFAGFKIQKEVCEAFGVEMEARLEPEREGMDL